MSCDVVGSAGLHLVGSPHGVVGRVWPDAVMPPYYVRTIEYYVTFPLVLLACFSFRVVLAVLAAVLLACSIRTERNVCECTQTLPL